ncbi:RodZ domain-containing protein [Alphaproteobacteria bacterium LSUCC0744]
MVANDSFEQIGSTLKSARRGQGVKILDVSQQLRISGDYLSHLESGEFDQLPAPAYVKGFLRSYGQFLGLDPVSLVARYAAVASEETMVPEYKMPMGARPPQRSAPAIVSMLLVFAGIGYGGWYWLNGPDQADQGTMAPAEIASREWASGLSVPLAIKGSSHQEDQLSNRRQDSTEDSTQAGTSPKGDAGGDDLRDVTPIITAATSPALPAETGAAKPPASTRTPAQAATTSLGKKPVAETPAQAGANNADNTILAEATLKTPAPNSGPATDRTATDLSVDSPGVNAAIANLRDPAQEITIRAVTASWVEIVRDNGEEVITKLMQAGDSQVIGGNERLYLSTGNAGGLTIEVGSDKPRSLGDIGEIVRDLPLVTDKLLEMR